jgi:Undecaprenyl-phosphate galactose phosphotransferase WbaP
VQQPVHAQGVLGVNAPERLLDRLLPLQVSHLTLMQVRLSKLALLLGDALAFALAFGVATFFTLSLLSVDASTWWRGQDTQRFAAWAVIAVIGLVVLLTRFQHYSDRRPFWDELSDFIKLLGVLSLLDMTLIAINRWEASRLWWVLAWPTTLCLLVLMRSFTRGVLKKMDIWVRPTIIIGIGANASDAALALQSQPELGLKVFGFVDAGAAPTDQVLDTMPRFFDDQIPKVARLPGIQWVIALEHAQADQREYWLRVLAQWGATEISVIPAMRGVPLHGTDMSHFFSHEVAMLRMRNNLRRWPARLMKRIFDTLIALALMVLLSPLMAMIGLLIRRDGGPALFAHPRVGKRGKVFHCYKFRTMVVDAEQRLEQLLQQKPELRHQWENERKLRHDPRVNRIGRFLRASSLDELPQLINVIRGEMSLVGPRPVVRAELRRFGADVGYYLLVRPGMTGLWQISGRSQLDYDKRVYLDVWYVKNWSLWYDLIILFKTVRVVIVRHGAY